MRALVVAMMLGGCWHDARPPGLEPTTSSSDGDDQIVRHHRAVQVSCQSLVPAMETMFGRSAGFQNQMPAILEAVTTSCSEDGWSLDLITCLISSNDEHEAQKCSGLLTPEQLESLQKRLMVAISMGSPNAPSSP